MLMLSELILYFALVANIVSHPQLDWNKVYLRTCPYENDMEQRLARFAELIHLVSNNIPFAITQNDWNNEIVNDLFYENANIFAVVFPTTISDSQPYFSYPAFTAGLLDLTKHVTWYSMNALLHGGGSNDPTPTEFYGKPSDISLYEYLQQLPFGINIVHGLSYYQCDDLHAWGFNRANVYIKEQTTRSNICKPKTYVGTAEIYTVFKNVTNDFGNDEWLLEEWSIFWDIYAEKGAEFCVVSSAD
eukprot:418583_1